MYRILAQTAFALAVFATLASSTYAQQFMGTEPLTIDISPQYPKPYEPITVTPGSTTIDLSGSTVTFLVNGKVVQQGSGTESATLQTGGPGEKTTITVTVVNNGRTYTKDLVIRPAEVALITEPVSTTHPFYQGASLVASEGRLRLIALPDVRTAPGSRVPASALVYTWKLGDRILTDASGIGRSVLIATAPPRYRNALVSLTVTTQDSSIVAQTLTNLDPVEPIVRVYQNDPLIGPWFATALPASFSMTATEATFRAVPYFFAGLPTLVWSVNGAPSGGDKDITVRASGNGAGTANLDVSVSQPDNNQLADTALSVRFGVNKPLGIFGL